MHSTPPLFRAEMAGKVVTDFVLDDGELGISLADGWNISIWCTCALYSFGQEVALSRVNEISGKSLVSFERDGSIERLVFSNGLEVVVKLQKRKVSQPESMMVCGPNALIVVWND